MQNTRIWVLAGVLVTLVALVLGGLLGVKPQLDAAQTSDSERQAVEILNAEHVKQLASLKEQFTRVDEIAAEVAALRRSVPASLDLDTFTGEMAALESQFGVTVTSYAPQDPTMFVPSETLAGAIPATVDGTKFATVAVSISVTGTRENGLAFVGGLQSGDRLFFVSGLTVSEEEEGVTTVSITGLVYVLFDEPIETASVIAPAPTPDATAAQ